MTESTNELASRWKRLGASILDSIIATAVTIPLLAITGVFNELSQGQQPTIGQRITWFIGGLIMFLIINGYFLNKDGQTVGKKIFGIRIVSEQDQQILPLGKVFGLRYALSSLIGQIPFLGAIFCLVDILFIFRNDKRCIHDLIAGTIVVDA